MKPPWPPLLPDDAVVVAAPEEGGEAPVAVVVELPAVPEAGALEEEELVEEPEAAGAAGAGAGCIADEPVVAEPEALAAGRSVPAEGAGVV